ncbi:hypothetical protein ABN763_03925 [Spongiivirga sp. MCCC 1A20706]|uniref:hypothetical protein n=1 Tax=Spongiivirga sp. MCCC 1A20706 TaxID=3160963 RepID=UPI003977B4B5
MIKSNFRQLTYRLKIKYFTIAFSAILFFGCRTKKTAYKEDYRVNTFVKTNNKCPKFYYNSFSNMIKDTFLSIVEKDTFRLTEIKFECVTTAMLTQKVLFDSFGDWDAAVFPNNARHPMLVWENRILIKDDKTRYNIVAQGKESNEELYASIIVTNGLGEDQLSQVNQRNSIVDTVVALIRANDKKKRKFYNYYWNTVNSRKTN